MRPGSAAVVVLAGGSGTRVGAEVNKVYLPLAGRRVISWSLLTASRLPQVGPLVLVVRDQDVDLAARIVAEDLPGVRVDLVVGGSSRHASEAAAFAHLAPAVAEGLVEVIAVHDGARPLPGVDLFARVLVAATLAGGALPAVPALGVVRGLAGPGPASDRLVRVQTPQAFRAAELLAAYAAADACGFTGTDTASSVQEHSALTVQTVPGSVTNIKITFPQDVTVAEFLLRHRSAGAGAQ